MDESTARSQVAWETASTCPTSDCDVREVAHFNSQAIAVEGESARRWLHRYNPLRLAFVADAARTAGLCAGSGAQPLTGLRILDVGCGTGIFCEALAHAGAEVSGIDPAQSAVALARQLAPAQLSLRYASGLVSMERDLFDVVTAMEVIEHVPDPAAFLRDCAARVKPGGILVMSTINRTLRSWAYAIVMAEKVLRLLPRGAHDWSRFVKPSEAQAVLSDLGLMPLACWGAGMNLRSKLMQRSSCCDVNYLLAVKRPH